MRTVTLTDDDAGRSEAWKTTPDEPLSDVILRQVADPAPSPLSDPDLNCDAQVSPGQFLGCMRGTVIFHPGWDDPLPLEMWDAYRDDGEAPLGRSLSKA